MSFSFSPCTLFVAPSGLRNRNTGHSARSRVAALERGVAITCELRLALNQMPHSLLDRAHLHRLKVAVH